jgi:hypothetical protein
METIDIKEKFIELRAKGYSFDRIAKELNKSKQTLLEWNSELKEEIANCKAMELEALQEKFYLMKAQRITVFGEMLQKIKTELDKRDLKDLETDKLLDLFSKYHSLLSAEIIEPVFKTAEEIQSEKSERKSLNKLTS